jgi:F-type H+-transporting ATPase subunit b
MGRLGRLTRSIGFACLSVLAVLPPGIVLAAEEAAKHEEPGIINLNVTLLIQAINFLILIALLSRFLFSPLRKFLADRAEGIEKALAEAKVAREAAAKSQEEYRAQILATQREAAAMREQAQREVEAERQRLLKASRDEAQRLVEEARAAIEAETKRARATLREEVVSLSLAAAERLLGRSMTGEDQKRLAEQYVRELGGKN